MPGPANDQPINLKHRLTGAVILIGLAVAVMSLLLDDGEQPTRTQSSSGEVVEDSFISRISGSDERAFRVPAPTGAPAETALRSKPSRSGEAPASDAGGGGAAVAVPEAATPEPALQVEPVLEPATGLPGAAPRINTVDARPVVEEDESAASRVASRRETNAGTASWVVRVGAFSEQSNADGVSRRLKAGGYAPSSASVTVNGKSMVRVWIGPYPDRKSAVRAKADLSRDFDLNGFVARQP